VSSGTNGVVRGLTLRAPKGGEATPDL
jgi:hypothetical protein